MTFFQTIQPVLIALSFFCITSSQALAGNSHDLDLDFGDQAARMTQTGDGYNKKTGSTELIFKGSGSSGGKTIAVDDLKVTTINEVRSDIIAGKGAQVSIGDVELSDLQANSITIDTRNTVVKTIDVSDVQDFQMGTVKLKGFHGNSATIKHDNFLGGDVKVQSGSSVSIGKAQIGIIPDSNDSGLSRGNIEKEMIIPQQPGNVDCSDIDQKAADYLAHLQKDLIYAYMAECAYGPERCSKVSGFIEAAGWEPVALQEEAGKTVEYNIYKNKTGEVVVSFRGTAGDDDESSIADWWENAVGNDETAVRDLAATIVDHYGAENVTFVGHSKGGGEALWASEETQANAVTFNHRPEENTQYLYDDGTAWGYGVDGDPLGIGRGISDSKIASIVAGGVAGGIAGGVVAGPVGIAIGGVVGGIGGGRIGGETGGNENLTPLPGVDGYNDIAVDHGNNMVIAGIQDMITKTQMYLIQKNNGHGCNQLISS